MRQELHLAGIKSIRKERTAGRLRVVRAVRLAV